MFFYPPISTPSPDRPERNMDVFAMLTMASLPITYSVRLCRPWRGYGNKAKQTGGRVSMHPCSRRLRSSGGRRTRSTVPAELASAEDAAMRSLASQVVRDRAFSTEECSAVTRWGVSTVRWVQRLPQRTAPHGSARRLCLATRLAACALSARAAALPAQRLAVNSLEANPDRAPRTPAHFTASAAAWTTCEVV